MDHERLRSYQTSYLRNNKRRSRQKTFRAVVVFILSLIACYPFFSLSEREVSESVLSDDTSKDVDNSMELYTAKSVLNKVYRRGYPQLDTVEDNKFVEYLNGQKVVYTIDVTLQRKIESIFRKYKVPYGSFVALEPSTGKVLAYASYTKEKYDLREFNIRSSYPAASLFKIITAAGVLEEGLLSRTSVLGYEGSPYKLNKRKIKNNPKRDRNLSSLEEAFGKSNNVVFGKVGANVLGSSNLREYANRFKFDSVIDFDLPVEISRADIPVKKYPLARVSAGFSGTFISPLHAALISSTVANNGSMYRPYLIESIIDSEQKVLYTGKPSLVQKVISTRASRELKKMMLLTVKRGTAAKIFKKYAKNMVRKISIGGKTGTLYGKNPPGLYDWFVGFGPEKDSKIAVAALVVNGRKWWIKGTYVAQSAFKTYLNY